MGEILPFKRPNDHTPEVRRDPNRQYGEGEAVCLNCQHTWTAIVETGTTQLECPKCHTMKGLLKYPYSVVEGSYLRTCNCGNQLFYLTPEGHLCPQCGIYQEYE